MEYYEDFKFGEKKLSDFGGIIYNSDGFRKSVGTDPSHITLSIPNKGEIYYGTQLSALTYDVDCYFEQSLSSKEIASWICKNEEQRFQYIDDDKYCNAVYNGKLEFDIWGGEIEDKSLTTIPFICYEGFWRAIENPMTISRPTINQIYRINGSNNIDSYPTISIIPSSSTIRLKWNDMYIALKDLGIGKQYCLDGENGDFYYLNSGEKAFAMPCLYTDDYYTMPTLKPFITNEIALLEGSITELTINKNSRILV